MKLTRVDLVARLNDQLALISSSIRIVDYDVSTCRLNTGEVLDRKGFLKFRKRLNSDIFCGKFDAIYAVDGQHRSNGEYQIRKELASKAARVNIEKNGPLVRARATHNIEQARREGRCGFHKGHVPWNTGLTKEQSPILQTIATKRMGEKNWQYGKAISSATKELQSSSIRRKILDGSFTPNVNNSRTHWEVLLAGKKYRSSWEAAFAYLHPHCLYEKIRIPYLYENKERVFIVDFVDQSRRILFEIKPQSQWNSLKNQVKHAAAVEWCTTEGYQFHCVTEVYFVQKWDQLVLDAFDAHSRHNLEKMYETHKKNLDRKAI